MKKQKVLSLILAAALCVGTPASAMAAEFSSGSENDAVQVATEETTEATTENVKDAECLIIDCFGLLSSIYHYADVTYVGGGFGVGIHNVLEAAVWNKPVIFGPNNKHFQEALGLIKAGGGFEIKDYGEFTGLMRKLEGDDAFLQKTSHVAGAFVESLAGATDKILQEVRL